MNDLSLPRLLNLEATACIPAQGARVPTVLFAAGGGGEAAAVLQRTLGCTNVLMDAGTPYSREAVTMLVGRRMQTKMVDGKRVGDGATSLAASHLLASAAWVRASACATLDEQAASLPVGAAATCTLSGVTSTRDHGDEAYVVVRFGQSGQDVIEVHVKWAHKQMRCDRDEQSEIVSLIMLRALRVARGDRDTLVESIQRIAWGIEELTWRVYRRVIPLPPEGQDAYLPALGTEWIPLPKLDPATHYLFSGSFRPLHHAHLHNRTQVDLHTGRRGVLQLSRNHPKKGPIEPARIQELAAAAYGVCDLLVGEDDGRYADKVARWGLDVALGTDVFPHITGIDCLKIQGKDRKLLLIGRPGESNPKTLADAASYGFPLVYCCPYEVSSTDLRARQNPAPKAVDLAVAPAA